MPVSPLRITFELAEKNNQKHITSRYNDPCKCIMAQSIHMANNRFKISPGFKKNEAHTLMLTNHMEESS